MFTNSLGNSENYNENSLTLCESEKISIKDNRYPQMLKSISDAPEIIYTKGNYIQALFENCIAIVGSRKLTPYGEKVVDYICGSLSKEITVVSGFMTGIDTSAHLSALKYGLKTIAVMPCGIDNVVPSSNRYLYKEIIQNEGLILSEWEGRIEPKNWTFPRRNRLIAGLCKVVIVVEAAENSGSLITADYAVKYNRKLFAVPGSIFSPNSAGTCKLISESAEILFDPVRINKYLNVWLHVNKSREKEAGEEDSNVLPALNSQPMGLDELSVICQRSPAELSQELLDLQICGKVKLIRGTYYAC